MPVQCLDNQCHFHCVTFHLHVASDAKFTFYLINSDYMEHSAFLLHALQSETLYILCRGIQALNLVQLCFIVKCHGVNSKGSCMTDVRGWFGRIGEDDTTGVHP